MYATAIATALGARKRRKDAKSAAQAQMPPGAMMMVPVGAPAKQVSVLAAGKKLLIVGLAALMVFGVISVIGFFEHFGPLNGLHAPKISNPFHLPEETVVTAPAEKNFRAWIRDEAVFNAQAEGRNVGVNPRRIKAGWFWKEQQFTGQALVHGQIPLDNTEVHAKVDTWPTTTERGKLTVVGIIHAKPTVAWEWDWNNPDPKLRPHVHQDKSGMEKGLEFLEKAAPMPDFVPDLFKPSDIQATEIFDDAKKQLESQIAADPQLIPNAIAHCEDHFGHNYQEVAQTTLDMVGQRYPDAARFDIVATVKVDNPDDQTSPQQAADVSPS